MSGDLPSPFPASPYPARNDFRGIFALHFLRLIHKRGVAVQFGSTAVALLMTVVVKEDTLKRQVEFFNAELMTACGCSEETLVAVRTKLVNGGWLAYLKGAKRRPGLYAVLEPQGFTQSNRGESEEIHPAEPGGNAGYTQSNGGESDATGTDSPSQIGVNLEIHPENTPSKTGALLSYIPNQISPSSNTEQEKEDWDGLTEKMLKAGIGMALPWTALARSRGFSASVVSGWIDEVQPMVAMRKCKWGVIGVRLEKDAVIGSNWKFPGLEEFRLEAKRREAEERAKIEAARKAVAHVKAAEESRIKQEKLEQRFGKMMKAMTAKQARELFPEEKAFVASLITGDDWKDKPLLRAEVMSQLEARHGSDHPPCTFPQRQRPANEDAATTATR